MKPTLTKRQKEILDYIQEYITGHDYAPSFREIGEYFGFSSTATVAEHIETLKSKGYLESSENMARSIQLTPTWDERSFSIPLLGLVAAGRPIEAIRTNETIDIPRDMMGPNVFALRVRGDSMVDDGIFDGDYIVVKETNYARNGEIIVALIDNENVTLKRFYQEKGRVRLQPANKNHQPIFPKKVIVQGKVRGVIRRFN